MTTTLNPHFLSELEATPTNQITDAVDSIHSGIVKALHLAARGTYALKDTGADFDITQDTDSSVTRLRVKGGKAYRDGVLVTLGGGVGTTNDRVCAANYDPGTGAVDVTPVSGGDVYLFLVGNSSNALVLRGTNGTTGKVPELVEGDIPIAIVKVVASSDDDATNRPIQYLTTSKVANTVSVGYDSSGYTEAGNITGSASGTTITPTLGGVIIDKDRVGADVSAEDITTLKIDFDRATQDSGTAAHNDIGIDLDVSSSSKGTSTAIGMDVDVVGAGSGTQTVTGLDVAVSGGDTNYAAKFTGGSILIQEQADAVADIAAYGQLWVNTATPNELYFTTDAGNDIALTSGTSALGGASALNDLSDVSYSSGDLTITSLDTVTFANGGAAVVTVANTAANTAGKNLTISAGSEPGGASNNANGGDLILASGGGDGTGTSAMTFKTKVSGTDAVAERMRIHTDGNVGIGTAAPAYDLHIKDSSTGAQLVLETDDDGSSGAPDLILWRNSASPAADDFIGNIMFSGETDSSAMAAYVDINTQISNPGNSAKSGTMHMRAASANSLLKYLSLYGADGSSQVAELVVNQDSNDINFRVESNGDANMFFVDGGNDKIGIGTATPAADLEVLDTTTSSATQGGSLRLSANDGATMADDHRLGVIEFAGAEDGSATMTVGARIEAICDATWSASENGASMAFYTTDGNATQTEVMRITSDKFVGIGTDAPNQPLTIEGTMSMKEQAGANADVAAYGQLWIKSDTPNSLYFTDDAGNDIVLATGGINAGLGYSAGNASHWHGGSAPTTVATALDRIASKLNDINSAAGFGLP